MAHRKTSPVKLNRTPEPVAVEQRWLRLIQVGGMVLATCSLGLFLASMPFVFQHLHQLCTSNGCAVDQLTPAVAGALQQAGLSLASYATVTLTVNLITLLIWIGVATMIVWRKPTDPMALLVALTLALVGTTNGTGISSAFDQFSYPVAARLLNVISGPALFLAFSLFPSGRFVPRWTPWLVLFFTLMGIPYDFFPGWPFNLSYNAWLLLYGCLFIGSILALVAAQISRYRFVSTLRQRQQTKWIIVGIGIALLFYLVTTVLDILLPTPAGAASLFLLGIQILSTLASSFIPLSIAISILRYRLWDIDAIINKALVYGLLSVLLAAVYAGLVLGLQVLLGGLLHQTNAIALVVSTLAIYALFQPLRHRIQQVIDHRFYRRKYDAAKVVAAFSTTLRNEMDLDQLRAQLLEVVQETMQPSHVSLWVRQPGRPETRSLQTGKPSPEEAGVHKEIAVHGV